MIFDDPTLNSPIRRVRARVELRDSNNTLVNTFFYYDKIISITIDRIGDKTKFFGFGVSQKATIKLLDKDRTINITKDNYMKIEFNTWGQKNGYSVGADDNDQFPFFYVEDVSRDENTNTLTVVGYDLIHKASTITLNDIGWNTIPSTTVAFPLDAMAMALAENIGLEYVWFSPAETISEIFETPLLKEHINLEGTETVKEVFDDIAEYTGTIYYIDNCTIGFKRIQPTNYLDITKDIYFTLETKADKALWELIHTTVLGDSLCVAEVNSIGDCKMIIRDNAFFTLDDNIGSNLYNVLIANINQTTEFNLEWRGSPYLEIGDYLRIETKDGDSIYGFVFNDTIEYNGGYKHITSWEYQEDDTEEQPASVGDALKLTSAKVDKVNKEITLAVKDIDNLNKSISQLRVDTNGITTTVQNMSNEVSKLAQTAITEDKVETIIQNTPVNSVTTTTGFTFNKDGLTVAKSDNPDITTTITEDGMVINQKGNEVLKVDNTGVNARNLHATTYLLIGVNSRFEDYYNGTRTGCFWIGG